MNIKNKSKIAVISGSFLGFVGILIGTSLVVTFPTLMRDFNMQLSTIQWLSSGYYLIATVMMSTTAYIMKHVSLRKIFIVSIILFLLGCIISAFSHNFIILLLGCLMNSVATGIATPLMYQIVFYDIPSNSFGKFNGIVTMIKSFGPAFGPTYGGILTYLLSWRYIFIGVLPIILVVFFMGIYSIPNNKINNISDIKFNYLGWFLFGISLIIFSLIINKIGTNFGHFDVVLLLLILLICFFSLFLINLKKSKRIFLNFGILSNSVVLNRAVTFFSLQFMNLSLAFLLPLFAEDVLHENSMMAGLILFPGAVLGAMISPFAGRIYDHKGAYFTLTVSSSLLFVGVLFYCVFFKFLNIIMMILFYIIFRLGYTFGFGNLIADAGRYVTDRSSVSALFNTFQQYSGTIGTNLMSTIISIYEFMGFSKYNAIFWGGRLGTVLLLIISILVIYLSTRRKKQ